MTEDFRTFQEFQLRCQWPRTSLGKWSLALAGGFIVLMSTLIAIGSRGGATNDFLLICTTVAALLLAVAGLIAAYAAIARKGERSILMLLPLLAGGFAVIMAIGELVGH